MTDFVPGGRRRIDRILDPEYLLDLDTLPVDELRDRADLAAAELAGLGDLSALLDERSAMIVAEERRRAERRHAAEEDGDPADLPADAAEPGAAAGSPRRLARVFGLRATPEQPPTRRRRRRVERLISDVDLSDVSTRTDDELARVLRTFRHEQRLLGDVHARVRAVVARCTDELSRRGANASRTTRTSRGGTGKLRGLPDRSGTASR